ncbi:carbohydrate kinase [Chitinophagaceae bacterium LB-8]|uniref:Carbohydrate kinase n=1 Tax=Paraflavisolibacter caeni TaxID=2982496 RepID=A0A9X2XTG8_9BACT|nr:carbohydrate kinase [Paraflavisolibacter caeni]MCU7548696.1 carbohydrate kinase [Paraflavisolibacter caeni]
MKPSLLQRDVVCFGEVLWDILPDKALPGGAPMNVAYHLKKLGTNPAMITRIGKDEYGEKLVELLSQNNISTDYIQVDDNHSTGLVYAKLKAQNEMIYDIVQPAAWDFIQWDDQLNESVKQSKFFVYGSLTSRDQVSRDTLYKLLDIANAKVLDINLRPPHFNRSLVEYLLGKADILKLNNAELELITSWYSKFLHAEDRMKLLQDRFHIETVVVTLGDEGAMLLENDSVSRHPGYHVQVADTIGSGDAFLAGFIHQIIKGAASQQALSFACGAGALIASKSGGCPQYETSEIHAMMHTYSKQQSISSI